MSDDELMTTAIISCPECFHNHGFKTVLYSVGRPSAPACPRCSGKSGIGLDATALHEAVEMFFVDGSVVAETLAPVYAVGAGDIPAAELDGSLVRDAATIRGLVDSSIFHNAPPLWRLGYTNHYHALREADPAKADALLTKGHAVEIAADTLLYRVRLGMLTGPRLLDTDSFDPPPDHIARSWGRWDDGALPILYVADDIELCLHECRTAISDEITLATLRTRCPLRLLDIAAGFDDNGGTRFDDGQLFADFLSRSRGDTWFAITRAVAQAAARAGYDGLRYYSYYSFTMEKCSGLNLALFGRPIADGKLEIASVNRVRITDVHYGFRLGPVLYDADNAPRPEE